MSTSPTPPSRYTLTAIVLHWLLGAALLGVIAVGWYMADLPFSPQRLKLYNWHKWAGITILVLSAARLLWRFTHRPPDLPAAIQDAMPRWQTVAFHATHHGLYALFFVVPLLGWAYSSAAGFPIVVFGVLPLPDLLSPDKALAEAIKPWHGYAAYLLLALIAAHVGAAIKHHFIDRDGLIGRMLPTKEKL
jgi:cytochrome b561